MNVNTGCWNVLGRSTINVNTGTIHKGLCELLNQNGQTMTTTATYPEVKFKHLPFYDLLGEILRPVSLGETLTCCFTELTVCVICFCLVNFSHVVVTAPVIPLDSKNRIYTHILT